VTVDSASNRMTVAAVVGYSLAATMVGLIGQRICTSAGRPGLRGLMSTTWS
jgi:hypothetical protein